MSAASTVSFNTPDTIKRAIQEQQTVTIIPTPFLTSWIRAVMNCADIVDNDHRRDELGMIATHMEMFADKQSFSLHACPVHFEADVGPHLIDGDDS